MSKLRDRIRGALQRRPTPLGFGSHARQGGATRRVIVIAEVGDASAAAAAIGAGVDAVLFDGDVAAIGAVVSSAGETPVGARVAAATAANADALITAGADFLVFDDERTEAAALLRDELGHVLALGDALAAPAAPEDQLRLLQPLDLDAVLVPGRGGVMTVRDQLLTRRIADLTRRPLIVSVDASTDATQLEVWRDAGAPAVLVASGDPAALERLVAAANAVPEQRERREQRPDALVPALPGAGHFDDGDDGEGI